MRSSFNDNNIFNDILLLSWKVIFSFFLRNVTLKRYMFFWKSSQLKANLLYLDIIYKESPYLLLI